MRYPALIDFDGDRLVADFPDCPGCSASIEASGDVVAAARAALHRWLESCLVEGVIPPRPSVAVVSRDWFEWIGVEPSLARRLLLRWAVAKRISRGELARRSGLSEDDIAKLQDERAVPPPELLEGVARALGILGGAARAPARTRHQRQDATRPRPVPRATVTPAARQRRTP